MQRRIVNVFISGTLACVASWAAIQHVTPAPSGPFHVAGNRIIDSSGRPFLMRGTRLTDFNLSTIAVDNRSGMDFGPHSATVLSSIRLRFNMNTVRLPLHTREATDARFLPELAKVVRRANDVNLLVVLSAADAGTDFWGRCAAYFKDQPNVWFDVSSAEGPETVSKSVASIRASGAVQPVIAPIAPATGVAIDDANIIYAVTPHYSTTRTDSDRDRQFGFVAARAPVVANGLDLELDDLEKCSAIPTDPAAATALIQSSLDYFDAHEISWTASVYTPGKLVTELFGQDPTSLENGWTCGQAGYPVAGIGRLIEARLRTAEERKLYILGTGGGIEIARGGYALAYGPVMAQRDTQSSRYVNLPHTLGGITVQITDAAGVTRPAGLSWVAAGWGQINFVIPTESAVGPAKVTVERWDGSSTSAAVSIADAVPGFWTPHSCVGPVKGAVVQRFADGRTKTAPLASCKERDCKLFAVPLAKGAITRVRLSGSGFRYAGDASKIEVTIGGVRVPVVSFGSAGSDGMDQVTVQIPVSLSGLGETDLLCRIGGRVSNAVRIRI